MSKYNDTIYALSTPTGKSAIAVIRISGKQSLNILKKITLIKKIPPNKTKLTFLKFNKEIIDQVLVNFFKKPALTTTLPAQLALKYKLSIIPVFIQRDSNNKFIIEFQNAINSEDFKEKLKLTEKLNGVLEKMIIKNPNQWIWTHNRWKL